MTKASTAAPTAKVIYIYNSTGVRLRDLSLTPERVLEVLEGL